VRPEPPTEILIQAPAKVNLVLRVLDRRADGYHNLWSLMQTVGLFDELRFRIRHDSPEIRLRCDEATLPVDGRNLVHRAATAVLQSAGRPFGLDVRIEKRIPMGAGLGGGSSDAAATILAVTRLLGQHRSADDMAAVGQTVGSDVPFFFHAPTALVQGRGEEVAPVRLTGDRWIVLVNPGFSIATRWAYERLSETRREVRPLREDLRGLTRDAMLTWEQVLPLMENDFEAALHPVHPTLRVIKHRLLDQGAEAALLSGSGATVFGVFRDRQTALAAQDSVAREAELRAHVAPICAGPLLCREVPASHPAAVG
jgi:4-diphosphocytidyl-2-C-methyl-D-erythritol kinase